MVLDNFSISRLGFTSNHRPVSASVLQSSPCISHPGMSVKTRTIPVAGLSVNVHTCDQMETQSVAVVFLLHGRMGSTKSRYMDTFIARLLCHSDNEQTSVSNSSKGLVVVTFVRFGLSGSLGLI